jgi:hypothetical protein
VSATSAPAFAQRARGTAARGWARLLADDRPSLREVALYGAFMAVVAAVLLGRHVKDAGFFSDDWAYRAVWVQTDDKGFFGQINNFLGSDGLKGRPTLAVYLSFLQQSLGSRQGAYLAWAAVLAVVFSVAVYLLLRTLGLRRLDAGLIGVLVLVFPASDSTRIWSMISDASFAMTLAVLGVYCVIRSLQVDGRRASLALRIGGSVLMVLGVTTYELTFVALLCSFVLYRTQVGWRETLKNAVVDWVVLGLTYALVISQSTAQHLPLSDAIDHGWTVCKQVFTLIATIALPLDSAGAGIALCAAILLGAVVLGRRLPTGDPTRAALTRWLWTALIAAIMIAASYVLYGPAAPFYEPLAPGLINRTNAFGAVPIVVFVYALAALLGTMVFRALREDRGVAAAATAAIALLLVVDYTSSMTHHLKLWDSGYKRAQAGLARFTSKVPPPPRGTLIVFYGQPIQETQNIPVWSHYWDLNGALQLTYHDPSLRGRPAFPGTRVQCDKRSATLLNDLYAGVVLPTDDTPYGKLYLFDSNSGVLGVPKNQAECRDMAPKFIPGPMLAPDPGSQA